VHTSWTNPNHAHADAVAGFIQAVLDRTRPNPFLDDFRSFQQRIAEYGIYNSLAQLLLKITAPGVPDFYQGTELWDFSLVDPDNRRPVDYALRARLLSDLQRASAGAGQDRGALARELLESRADGRVKLYITMAALEYRRRHPSLFREGAYLPLESTGTRKDHVVGFARVAQNDAVVVVVPRLIAGLLAGRTTSPTGSAVWEDTVVLLPPPGTERPEHGTPQYRNLLTGAVLTGQDREGRQALRLDQVFADFPVAMLEPNA
jgi:(1->4)-alpha-D-glucan 1-alpha-D-glucosylmutase